MYETIKKLVEQNELTFVGDHRSNLSYHLGTDPENFLQRIAYSARGISAGEDRPVANDVYCFDCGAYVDYTIHENQLIPSEPKCFKENVIVDISVPSGVLLVDDWLEEATTLFEHLDGDEDINSRQGVAIRTRRYADAGVGHFFVGNSSPEAYKKDGVLYFGRDTIDEEDNDIPLVKNGKHLGSVSTDLWWVTLCDRDTYKQMAISKWGEERGREVAKTAEEECDIVIRVSPGNYRLHYFTEHNETLFATLTKV